MTDRLLRLLNLVLNFDRLFDSRRTVLFAERARRADAMLPCCISDPWRRARSLHNSAIVDKVQAARTRTRETDQSHGSAAGLLRIELPSADEPP